jgi:hypothetical protein
MIPRLSQIHQHPDIHSSFLLRKSEIHAFSQILVAYGDLMLTGVSGSGRRALLHPHQF